MAIFLSVRPGPAHTFDPGYALKVSFLATSDDMDDMDEVDDMDGGGGSYGGEASERFAGLLIREELINFSPKT